VQVSDFVHMRTKSYAPASVVFVLVVAVVDELIFVIEVIIVIEIKHLCVVSLVVVYQWLRNVSVLVDPGLQRVSVASGVRHVVQIDHIAIGFAVAYLDADSASR